MNQDELLRQRISIQPAETQVAEAAARARRRALERIDGPWRVAPRAQRWPALAVAATLAGCAAVLLWRAGGLPAPSPAAPAAVERAAEPPMKMILTLADGTRVIWTIDANLSL